MKNRFNTYDVVCIIAELQKLIGMRVNQVYDIDNKTYLIRLQRTEEKCVLLLESGNRLHTTAFEWPKNVAPSGFTMKLRKHLKNKRLEKLEQLGIDRIIDLQFGTAEAAYHVILELYDRGNIILTDYELTILNVLRPHTEGEEIRFIVREKYPINRAKQDVGLPNMEHLIKSINSARPGDNLRSILNPLLECGPSVIDHVLLKYNLNKYKLAGTKNENEIQVTEGKKKQRKNRDKDNLFAASEIFNIETNLTALMNAINDADNILKNGATMASKGFIIQRKELKPSQNNDLEEFFYTNLEYHPMLFLHDKERPYKEYDSFNMAIDEFYSALEGQKIDIKAIQQERDALKKLSNVKKDHAKRLDDLTKTQKFDRKKAELITRNQILVDNAILAIQSSLANQMSWPDIHELVKAAQQNNDPVAKCIKQLKLEINHISLHLTDPFANLDDESDSDTDDEANDDKLEAMTIDIDLSLSAFANARKYYDQRRTAAKKEQKTIESSVKALKNAERKTQQTLKDVKIISTITKARKIYWFEKFYWFISSENYLIIGGRDQQQNELIVKRYMRPQDIYVHAEIQGASSVIIKNPTGNDIPPKTLLEAGTMAISYSVAWDAKVVTNAYWVKSEQVSKTAPTGEYLGTGSFMIRGKKNFLPPCHLILGLSFLFKLEDSSIERHKNERRIRTFDDAEQIKSLNINEDKLETLDEEEIDLNDDEDAADDNIDDKSEEKEKEDDNKSSDNDSDSEMQYPDTHIKVEHDISKLTVESDSKFDKLPRKNSTNDNNDDGGNDNIIFLGDDKPFIVKSQQSRVKQQNKKSRNKAQLQAAVAKKVQEEEEGEQQKSSQAKRGQKGKLKKIKEKYKDQDEDEREMRMAILKSAGSGSVSGSKDTKKGKKLLEQEIKIKRQIKMPEIKPNIDEETDEVPAAADVDMLDSLTGAPVDEDELLFSVPVIAPYQALHSYKYKVKLTPGTGKRGKAAKTALAIFLKDKACTQREKDLLKSVKDETLARNIPGKVKLSAPQLQRIRK